MEGNFPLEASSWPMKPNQSFLVSSEDLHPFLLQSRRKESSGAPPSGQDHKDGRLFPTPPPPPPPSPAALQGHLVDQKIEPIPLTNHQDKRQMNQKSKCKR